MLTLVYNLQIHRYIATEHNDVFFFVIGVHRVFLVLVHFEIFHFHVMFVPTITSSKPQEFLTRLSGWPALTGDFPF